MALIHQSTGKLAFAKKLRKRMTPAEKFLWILLRAKRLEGLKFRRQAPIGPYIVDFLSYRHRLIIEVDGDIHEYQKTYDQERDNYLRSLGFRVIRFSNDAVLNHLRSVLSAIEDATHASQLTRVVAAIPSVSSPLTPSPLEG